MAERVTMRASMVAVVGVALVLLALTGDSVAGRPALTGVVNINTATADELRLLPGIGPAKARLVIEYRTAHPFRTVEELARVKGIGPKTVRKLRPHLTVRGATTAGPAGTTGPSPADAPAATAAPTATVAPVPRPSPARASPPPPPSPPRTSTWAGPVCPSFCRLP
jgi:competence protein ComEA